MDALLILGGLLLMLGALVVLVMRAFATSLLWGGATLLPPLALAFVFAHWQRARQAVVLFGLGLIPLVVGLALTASQDPQRFAAILALEWLHPRPQDPAQLQIQLNGQLNGEPFRPQQGEFVDGVLTLREGQDFFASRELVIRGLPGGEQALRADVLPTDPGRLPLVELNWLLADQALPEARRLTGGYTLHLDLQPKAPDRLAGDFHLVLPPQYRTTLSGRLEVFRSGRLERDGTGDRRLDSRDPQAHVIGGDRHTAVASSPSVSTAAVPRSQAPAVAYSAAPSLVLLLAEPERYLGQPLRIVTDRGSSAQGRFVELDAQGQIILRQRLDKGAGEARFAIDPESVSHIERFDP